MVIGGYNPFHNYFCTAHSCFFSFALLEIQKFLWKLPGGQGLHTRFLELSCHTILVLPTRLHSNTSSSLLYFFYLLETLELHLVARRLSPGGPSRSILLWWWNLQFPHILEIAVCHRTCDELHLLLLTWNPQIKYPFLMNSFATEFWRRLLHWRRYCHLKVTNSSIAMQDTKDQILKLLFPR